MVYEGQSKRVHGAFMRAPMGLTVVDPLGDNDVPLNIERDRLGSMRRARFEDTSALTQREYGPYGETYSNNGGDLLFGYTGHIALNPDTSFPIYAAPYRNYSPVSARWLTRDPLGMVDGPNVYGYVKGNPVRYRDAMGLWSICEAIRDACAEVCQLLHDPFGDPEGFFECIETCDRIGEECEDFLWQHPPFPPPHWNCLSEFSVPWFVDEFGNGFWLLPFYE